MKQNKVIGRARGYETDRANNDDGQVASHERQRQATVRRAAARAQVQGLRRIAQRK